jgi:CheY-like chemotaxis protein
MLVDDSDTVLSDPESLRGVDVMILDQRMPKTTGLDLLACLRRRGAGDMQTAAPGYPAVILISAYLSEAIRERAARLGVIEVIEKPVDTAHLLACVRAALAERPPCP